MFVSVAACFLFSRTGSNSSNPCARMEVLTELHARNYRGQNVEADVYGFSLPGVWLRKSEPTLAQGTCELVAPPDLPHLALVARPYHGVEATSFQAERNFSSLSFLIGTLRASMSPFKVEQMMFLKLNQR